MALQRNKPQLKHNTEVIQKSVNVFLFNGDCNNYQNGSTRLCPGEIKVTHNKGQQVG